MARLLASAVGKDICEALGIEATDVAEVNILLKTGNVAILEIRRYLSASDMAKIAAKIEKYEVVLIK